MIDARAVAPTPDATAIAWDALRTELYRFVARRAAPADADDIVQEALLRIHRGLPSVRADGALVGWMYQVTRHALADHLRGSRPIEELVDDCVGDGELGSDVVGSDLVRPHGGHLVADDRAFESLARCVAPFVRMLPALYRQAVELVELRGMTQAQAAAQLGVPLSTLKSRVQRGRTQLRELLEACCAIDLDARGHVVAVTPRCRCAAAPVDD